MSLEAVLAAIRDSGEDQVREIEAAAHAEVQNTTAQNKSENQRLRQEAREKASALGAAERARILNQARLEAQSVINDVREELIDSALDDALKSLARLRKDPLYKDMSRHLIEETLAQIAGSLQENEKPQLEADPRDKALFKRILSNLKLKFNVDYDLDCLGGLIARSEDGRVVVINTVDARLARATPYLRRSLGVIFSASPSEPAVD
jgi:V/A-type H+-transporting ATPase subunit E